MTKPKDDSRDLDAINCSSSLVVCFVVAFAIYGLCRLMDDAGIVVHRNDEAQFWFEDDLRSWIHGK